MFVLVVGAQGGCFSLGPRASKVERGVNALDVGPL